MQNKVFSIDPSTGKKINSYDLDSDNTVNEKIRLADKAFKEWSLKSHNERASYLEKVSIKIKSLKQTIAEMITLEIGMPISQSLGEVDKALQLVDEIVKNGPQQLSSREVTHAKSRVDYSPLGVCLSVAPWNFPFYLALRSIIPNLMAGNTVVLKHSITCQGVAHLIEDCFNVEGITPGIVINLIVRGQRAETALRMNEIKIATLIGSERAGRSFASTAASLLKKVVLELGGNDPMVIFEDADLKAAAKAAADSRLRNCGQACNAAKRYLVHESVKEKFMELLIEEYNKFIPGDPKDPKTQLGPIATEEAAKTFLKQCELLERHGKLIHKVDFKFNENEISKFDYGYWVQPRLYELTDDSYCEEEIFGPAAAFKTFINDEDALRQINKSRFGLGCSIWTSDKDKFNSLSSKVEAGNVFLNSMVRSHVGLPYGGIKDSGYGRELGEEGLKELCNIKVVYTG